MPINHVSARPVPIWTPPYLYMQRCATSSFRSCCQRDLPINTWRVFQVCCVCNASPLTFTLHLRNGAWGGWRDGCHPCCGCRTHGSETQFAQWVCRDLKSSQVSSCGHALVMNPNEMLKACRRLAFSSSDHPGPRWAPTSGLHHRRLWRGVTCFVLLRNRFAMMVPLDKIVWSLQRLRCFLRAPNCTFWHILTSTCILTSRSAQRRKAELTSTPSHLTGNGYSTRRRW